MITLIGRQKGLKPGTPWMLSIWGLVHKKYNRSKRIPYTIIAFLFQSVRAFILMVPGLIILFKSRLIGDLSKNLFVGDNLSLVLLMIVGSIMLFLGGFSILEEAKLAHRIKRQQAV